MQPFLPLLSAATGGGKKRSERRRAGWRDPPFLSEARAKARGEQRSRNSARTSITITVAALASANDVACHYSLTFLRVRPPFLTVLSVCQNDRPRGHLWSVNPDLARLLRTFFFALNEMGLVNLVAKRDTEARCLLVRARARGHELVDKFARGKNVNWVVIVYNWCIPDWRKINEKYWYFRSGGRNFRVVFNLFEVREHFWLYEKFAEYQN